MDRRQALVGMAGAAMTPLTVPAAEAKAEASTDALNAKVRALADAYAAAWNASDMTAMGALYTPGVHWVNVVGMHWRGFGEVDRAHRAFFDIMFKGVPIALQEIESVTPLPGGAAVAVVRWSMGAYRTPDGTPLPPGRDRMTLVLVPDGDGLKIAHGANIHIDERAASNDPIRRPG